MLRLSEKENYKRFTTLLPERKRESREQGKFRKCVEIRTGKSKSLIRWKRLKGRKRGEKGGKGGKRRKRRI